MRHHPVCATLAVLGLALLGAPTAQAAKVRSLQPWKASNLYLVTADLDGRTQPKSEPRARENYLRKASGSASPVRPAAFPARDCGTGSACTTSPIAI